MNEEPVARHWINGELSEDGPRHPSVNPATGETFGYYHDADEHVAAAAVAAARTAFSESGWSEDAMLRATTLHRLADAYEQQTSELVETLMLENGKLRGQAAYEVHYIPRALRYAAGLSVVQAGRVTETMPGQQSMSILQPVGVAGIMTPWNSPAYLSIRSIAPALAAGCSVVLKMPGQAAHTARAMGDIFSSVETLPAGQVNIFIESGSAGARYMVAAKQVATVSFTGSTATGRAILEAAAAQIKRVGAELGGKTPHLIFADADLDAALDSVVQSITAFAGQFCMTGSRVLVHEDIADAFIDRLADRLAGVRLGPAADPTSEIGPMIDTAQVTRVDGMVEDAIAAGARVIVRGGPPSDGRLEGGAFYAPTLLEVAFSDLPIVQEEIFGPVQTVQRFTTEEEAIGLANDTDYGLSASVWTRDIDRATRVSRQVQAGLISINSWANLAVEFEEGGWKASGLGRLGGLASLEDFTEHKQITQNFA